MTDTLKPRDAKEVEEAVRWALGNDKALEVAGQGTKRAIGRPSQTDITLDLSGLSGVTLYEPEELVLSAKAGTPFAEIEALLDKNNQELGFEPMDYGPLFGLAPGQGTIGGTIAANLSGPRRIKAGAARDHFLGVTRGHRPRRDHQVRRPRGEERHRLRHVQGAGRLLGHARRHDRRHAESAAQGGDRGDRARRLALTMRSAARAMAAAMGSPCDVSGAAHLPDHVASWFDGLPKPEASDGVAAGRLRALGRAPQAGAGGADEAVRPGRVAR